MVDTLDALGDDRSFVQLVVYKVRGCANDFDATFVGLSIRICSNKRGEERVVYIDDVPSKVLNKFGAENTHVIGQDKVIQRIFQKMF